MQHAVSESGIPKQPPDETAGFLIPGLTLIFITIYAPFSIAALLGDRLSNIPLAVLVSIIFFSMAVGTFLSSIYTSTGLIVAPAVGMASFVNQTNQSTINTSHLLLATLFAGLVALWLSKPRAGPNKESRPSFRRRILDSIPPPVKVGVRGGIGALLAAAAVHGLSDLQEHEVTKEFYKPAVYLFVVSVLVILVAEIFQRVLESKQIAGGASGGPLLAILRSTVFLVPLAMFAALYGLGAFPMPTFEPVIALPEMHLYILDLTVPEDILSGMLITISFVAIILFIFIADIPGSPYDVISRKEDAQKIIDRSFMITSAVSSINPFVNLFTSVYYAENHVVVREDLSRTGVFTPSVAKFCACVFLGLGILFMFVDFPVAQMRLWLLVSVAPALFCLGIRLTARALWHDAEEDAGVAGRTPTAPASEPMLLTSYFIPISVTLILTHFIGFELALPLGICYYGLYVKVSRQPMPVSLGVLVGCSALVSIVLGVTRLT